MSRFEKQTAGPSQRQLRVGELVRHALADVFARGEAGVELDGVLISVAEVRMSPDMKHATALVAPLAGDPAAIVKRLDKSAKFLRGRIAPALKQMRAIPDLRFRLDTRFEDDAQIDALLRSPDVARDLGGDDGGDAGGDALMGRRDKGRKVDGWLVLDKPVGMTSTDAVAKVKRLFDAAKAGHAGTLDPLASGSLPIALGEATKTVSHAMDGRKLYRFTVRWGVETTTDDLEGEVAASSDRRPSEAEIADILPDFTGTISQVPPRFSAIKIAGERAYDLAREGEIVELEARLIDIHRLELVGHGPDEASFEAECGKGAYIRALARDMGRRLSTHGHIVALRRLAVGPFEEADMIPLEKLQELRHKADTSGGPGAEEALLSVATALDDIPALAMTERDAARLKRGQAVILRGRDAPVMSGPAYAVFGGLPVALGEVESGAFNPKRVFNLADGRDRPGSTHRGMTDVDHD